MPYKSKRFISLPAFAQKLQQKRRDAASLIAALRLFLGLGFLGMAFLSGTAEALKSPRPVGPDGRIYMMMYSPDEVFKFTGHYGYQSSIIFAPEEEILTISMGDSTPWMITPSGNRLFIKPIGQDASTNVTLLTNKRSYLFELHAEEAESINDPDLIFIMRFVYPSTGSNSIMTLDDVPDVEEEGLENFNFNYSIRGSYEVAPVTIFDDGQFTYFEFRNENTTIPAFYVVDQWGNESIINYRTRDDYIVVEQVGSRFTLRAGGQIVCVYNEANPLPSTPNPNNPQGQARQAPMPGGYATINGQPAPMSQSMQYQGQPAGPQAYGQPRLNPPQMNPQMNQPQMQTMPARPMMQQQPRPQMTPRPQSQAPRANAPDGLRPIYQQPRKSADNLRNIPGMNPISYGQQPNGLPAANSQMMQQPQTRIYP